MQIAKEEPTIIVLNKEILYYANNIGKTTQPYILVRNRTKSYRSMVENPKPEEERTSSPEILHWIELKLMVCFKKIRQRSN